MIEKVKHKGLALTVLAAAQFMVILDATITNVALPAIQKSLNFGATSDLQWVVTAYSLAFGGFLLLGGRLADLFGRRKIFMTGIVLFSLASLAAGFAQSPEQLIIFRALQGFGGAFLSPAALSLVLTIFQEGHERNKALGVWSMVAAGGGAVGLLLGGFLTQYVDWRWIFFINIPIGVMAFLAARVYVPASLPRDRERIDYLGAVTVTSSLMTLVYALAEAAKNGWGAHSTVLSFGIATVLMLTFIINEFMVKHPLMPLSIFRRRNVTGGNIIQLLMPAAMFGLFFYLSLYLQQIEHYSPTKTGLAMIPFTATVMVVAANLSRRMKNLNPKVLLTIAPLVAGSGLLYFSYLPLHAHYAIDILPGILLMASGMATIFVTNIAATTSGVGPREHGLISGMLNTGQQIGGAIGLAVLTVVSSHATADKVKELTATGQFNPAADLPQALVTGFQHGFRVAALFALAASITALTVFKVHRMTEQDIIRANDPSA